jgi:hypothetical protein
MPQPLLPPRKEPLVPLDRRISGLQSHSGCGGEEKNSQQYNKPKLWNNLLYYLQFPLY